VGKLRTDDALRSLLIPRERFVHQALKSGECVLDRTQFSRGSRIAPPLGVPSFKRRNSAFNATKQPDGVRFP